MEATAAGATVTTAFPAEMQMSDQAECTDLPQELLAWISNDM